ncbi:MAG: hypothetical protein WC346_16305 [Methanogenium sp.]|jgi:hypothetical protein
MGRKIKVGTNVQILFRPLKKLCEKRGWEWLYERFEKAKQNKTLLHTYIYDVPENGLYFESEKYNKEDGTYYGVMILRGDVEESWNIPTSCFRVIGDKKK